MSLNVYPLNEGKATYLIFRSTLDYLSEINYFNFINLVTSMCQSSDSGCRSQSQWYCIVGGGTICP